MNMSKWTNVTRHEAARLLRYWYSYGYNPYDSFAGHPSINRQYKVRS